MPLLFDDPWMGRVSCKGVHMPGETQLHKTLKKEACRWLFRMGYRCIAAEVRLRSLGIIDAVGTGDFRPYQNYLSTPRALPQVCFIECKASRADFLRDLSNDGQLQLCLFDRAANGKRKHRRRPLRQTIGLGKFDSCLVQPMANLHYVLAPSGVVQKNDLPPRWGMLTYGETGITVTHRAGWQELSRPEYVESAIARTLTGDIYRADDRAIGSINREIFAQQQQLAERIRTIKPKLVFDTNVDIEQLQREALNDVKPTATRHLRRSTQRSANSAPAVPSKSERAN